MSNPFRKVELDGDKQTPFVNFEQKGSRTSLLKGDFQSPNFATGEKGWKVNSDGQAEFTDLQVSGFIKTVSVGQSIQSAIDYLNAHGGGEIRLDAGTHTLTDDITLYSGISLVGAGQDITILDYNDSAFGIKAGVANGASVTGASRVSNFKIKDLTVKDANANAGIDIDFASLFIIENTEVNSGTGIGIRINRSELFRLNAIDSSGHGVDGIKITSGLGSATRNFTLDNIYSVNNVGHAIFINSVSNGIRDFSLNNCYTNGCLGDGFNIVDTSNAITHFLLTNCSSENNVNGFTINPGTTSQCHASLIGCRANDNSADGFNITNAVGLQMLVSAFSNGGQGIELVSGNTGCSIQAVVDSNTSDGIKLTATSDEIIIHNSQIINNGAYGVNIFASDCDSNLNNGCVFDENVSGAINNSGTTTLIRSNIGVADN